jgi:Ca2+:H+ antiporter
MDEHSEEDEIWERTSPTESRQPSRYEPITGRDDGLSESFQSTDTVRRRPDPSAALGKSNLCPLFGIFLSS